MKQKTENKYSSPDGRSTAAFIADVSIALFTENRVSLETQSVGLTKCYSHACVPCHYTIPSEWAFVRLS